MKPNKFCWNCKWCDASQYGHGYKSVMPLCTHPVYLSPRRTDLVTGVELGQTSVTYCETARNHRHECGPEAVLFEPIVTPPTIWRRILKLCKFAV